MQVVVQVVVEVLVPDRHGGQVLHAEVLSGVVVAQHPLRHAPGPRRSCARPPSCSGLRLFAQGLLCSSAASLHAGPFGAAATRAWAFRRRQSRRREVRRRRAVGVVAMFVGVQAGVAWRRWRGGS